MSKKTIAIGSDHAGFRLKQMLATVLADKGWDVRDLGAHNEESVDYPDYAKKVAEEVLELDCLGILVCGTGQGMGMTANRHPGVRAAVCANEYQAAMARLHNDANVLCLGQRVVGDGTALSVLEAFLGHEFEGGRHQRRVDKIERG